MRKYFGTDGIRGTVNIFPMEVDTILKLGRAAARVFQRGKHQHRVVIGKDTRLSGYMIESALTAGFTSMGMQVFLFGPLPTPAVSFLTRSLRADLGVMVTASHNSYEDNGIKFFDPEGYKLSDDIEVRIEKNMEQELPFPSPQTIGRAKRIDDAQARYIEFVKNTFPKNLSLKGLRIAVDCANGAAYRVAPTIFWELGSDNIELVGVKPNGVNINKDCGSTSPEALQKAVLAAKCDIGLAFDGDADRLLVVDEKGRIVPSDQILGMITKSWHEQNRLSAPGIVATVMSSLGLEHYVASLGLSMKRTHVGDRYISQYMRAHGYNIGGEPSGHTVLHDLSITGDGIVCALQVLALLQQSQQPVSILTSVFEDFPRITHNIKISKKLKKSLESSYIKDLTRRHEKRLKGKGRLVIHPSGTEDILRIMCEGEDATLIRHIVDDVSDTINSNPPPHA